jgi:hypothetical protein
MKKTIKKTAKSSIYKHGQWFRAKIQNEECVGRVSINDRGRVYLCQDDVSGATTSERFGFENSWCVESGSKSELSFNDVENLRLLSRKPASFKRLVELPNVGSYRAKITDGGETIKVGCTPVSRELYLEVGRKAGWIE